MDQCKLCTLRCPTNNWLSRLELMGPLTWRKSCSAQFHNCQCNDIC
jgi:hypothetical protein